MGTWGTSLYANDTASDLRSDYLDGLRNGKSNKDLTIELYRRYEVERQEPEEQALFWFALADVQWNYGRLLPEVMERALAFLSISRQDERWKEAGAAKLAAWNGTLDKLEQKLNTPQPPEKRVYRYRLYRCPWKIGDVFAYRLESQLAREKGLWGRFLLLQKVDETEWYPGHIIPIVYVKLTADERLPQNADEYDALEYVQTLFTKYEDRFLPIDFSRLQQDLEEKSKRNYEVDEFGFLPQFRLCMITTSKKLIPSRLTFVGNFRDTIPPQKEFIPHTKVNIRAQAWKTMEATLIRLYCGHNCREYAIYAKKDE